MTRIELFVFLKLLERILLTRIELFVFLKLLERILLTRIELFVFLKLLERILLTRIELFDDISPPIHSMQGGFKKQQGFLITSFIVKEAIQYTKEKNSKVYACFLDVKKRLIKFGMMGYFINFINVV